MVGKPAQILRKLAETVQKEGSMDEAFDLRLGTSMGKDCRAKKCAIADARFSRKLRQIGSPGAFSCFVEIFMFRGDMKMLLALFERIFFSERSPIFREYALAAADRMLDERQNGRMRLAKGWTWWRRT
jgi:hypothetical protein